MFECWNFVAVVNYLETTCSRRADAYVVFAKSQLSDVIEKNYLLLLK